MMYACSYDDCSYFEIAREIADGGEALPLEDPRRACGGTVHVGNDADGYLPRPCLRLLDALVPDGRDHVHMELPELPVAEIVESEQPPTPPAPTTTEILAALERLDPATATIADVISAISDAGAPVAAEPVTALQAPPTL